MTREKKLEIMIDLEEQLLHGDFYKTDFDVKKTKRKITTWKVELGKLRQIHS